VLFIIIQHMQPSFIIVAMHSQHAWIISAHLASPLVHVMVQPSFVMSHLHMPIVRLQQQTTIPFMTMQQLHMLPESMVQRFCTMLAAILSSQLQVIFMPPLHFSIFMVQRGTIIMLGVIVGAPIAGAAIPGIPMPAIPDRSSIIVPVMTKLLSGAAGLTGLPMVKAQSRANAGL
jgi:hypothetical protein